MVANTKILFYPDKLRHHNKLRYVLDHLCIEYTNDPNDDWTIGVFWDFNTTRSIPDVFFSCSKPVINYNCVTADKRYIDSIFKKVFNYTSSIDPTYFEGFCIRKSVNQATHDGIIIECPTYCDNNFVYQKIIDTRINERFIRDIRVPVFKNIIPCVFEKIRPVTQMYGGTNRKRNQIIYHENPNDLLNKEEQQLLIEFCKRVPVDYCELDVLRNNWDGKIYVVDMNNTPSGGLFLVMGLEKEETQLAIEHYSLQFQKIFLP